MTAWNEPVLTSTRTFARVIYALVLREAVTRFGRTRLGYVWAFLEPCAYVAIFVFGRAAIQDRVPFGESAILFVLTGLMAFRIAMSIANRTRSAITGNLALLAYPLVRTFDLMIARILLEATTMTIVFAGFFAGIVVFGGVHVQLQLEHMAAAVGAALLLGSGVGVFNAVVGVLLPSWDRVWGLVSLPLFITSGVFFLPSALPPEIMSILWWNPFLHAVEWTRDAAYLDYDPVLNRSYLISFGLTALFLGLLANRYFRQQVLDG